MVLDGKYDTRWTTADKFSKNTWKIWTPEYSVDSMETVGQTPKRKAARSNRVGDVKASCIFERLGVKCVGCFIHNNYQIDTIWQNTKIKVREQNENKNEQMEECCYSSITASL